MKRILQLFVVIATLAAVAGCDFGCGDEVVSTTSSPSHAISAVVFNRNCGATTGFNTQVSIVPAGAAPSGAGNTLILDGTVPLKFLWVSESKLLITGLGYAKVFKQERSVAGVSVVYDR
ncbi:hypothetical protein I6J77_13715 [Rhodanobacter sp. FDAARGOS 1247]|uniref:hypothetical protein n=1 Tax=Rhodanobacter sp. FDAARGOS 1247 TaxID=2778082 RepID=UPI0019527572|nr:hypothetical protein [Rhodanobacter sp. FDAARGOS 1247]QRP63164.1 hypothetical protein I6J77_13715 [Rhodanobacter sp. FDAARGOS 1247]